MYVFGSEMHLVTFVVIVLEFGMLFFYQLPHYLTRPEDKSRLWYMLLLVLLIIYNTAGGLMPDDSFGISIILQNILAYGSGFLMAAYFPFFFYRCLRYESLHLHALLWSPLCILCPFVVFFVGHYVVTGDLAVATSYGMLVPFVYSVWVLYAILDAIRMRFREDEVDGIEVVQFEAILLYCAVAPWVLMSIFAFLQMEQWIEVLCTNLGFLITTVVFISRSVKRERENHRQRMELENRPTFSEAFERNIYLYGFTPRELEVVRLTRQGYSRTEMADMLCISMGTLGKHIQFIHEKAEVSTRQQLMAKLEMP